MLVGNGKLDQVFIANQKSLTLNALGCMALSYSTKSVNAESPSIRPHAATVTIDANGNGGGTGPTIVVTIKRKDENGDNLTDLTYTISAVALGSGATSWSGTSPTFTADADTLKCAVDLLNLIPGVYAYALHAPWDMALRVTTFSDLAATYIPNAMDLQGALECLIPSTYLTNTDHVTAWMRIGLPECRDADAFKLIDIFGTCTGTTSGDVYLYKDDVRDYVAPTGTFATDMAKKEVLVEATLATPKAYGAGYVAANLLNAPTVVGPLILQVSATNLSALDMKVMIQQATIHA